MKIVVLFALFLLFSGSVYAQKESVATLKIKEIPSYHNELTKQKFLDNSKFYEKNPLGDKFLSYQVRLPKGWHAATARRPFYNKEKVKKEDFNKRRILGLVDRYYGPGRMETLSKFEIESQTLDFKVTAKNWFLQEVLLRGYTLEGLKVYSNNRVEALYVVVKGNTAFVVRAIIEINGSRIVEMSYYVPDKFWKKERASQQRVIESFRFLSPEKSTSKKTRSYAFLDLLTFDYPVSWRLTSPHISSLDGIEVKLIHTKDKVTLNGEMNIKIFSTEFEDSLAEEIGFLKEDIVSRGLEIGELIETRKNYKYDDYIYFSHVEAYKVFDKKNKIQEHEYWIAIMEEERYYYIVTMLTPARNSSFYIWAQNAEDFEVVIESFRP